MLVYNIQTIILFPLSDIYFYGRIKMSIFKIFRFVFEIVRYFAMKNSVYKHVFMPPARVTFVGIREKLIS